MNNKNTADKPTVVVTGFGPFGVHAVNSSWVAVSELSKLGIDGVNLVVQEIPVEYEEVKKNVPLLWQKYKPKLVVHCGVSNVANTLVLEQHAHNVGYYTSDIKGCLPSSNCCFDSGEECITSIFDMHKLSHEINSHGTDVPVIVSEDAGRYLCEFIYYSSLSINRNSAFIHVPPLDKPYTSKQLAEGIRCSILQMLTQLDGRNENETIGNNSV